MDWPLQDRLPAKLSCFEAATMTITTVMATVLHPNCPKIVVVLVAKNLL
jgi:hypothetical protein